MMNAVIRKSDFVQTVRSEKGIIVWHSLFGAPMSVTEDALEILDAFSTPITLATFHERYDLDNEAVTVLQDFLRTFYLVSLDCDERQMLTKHSRVIIDDLRIGAKVAFLELIVTESCNFRCTYCIHFNNLESTNRHSAIAKKVMNFEVAKVAVDGFFEVLQLNGKQEAILNFGGGEPLLGWSLIERVIEYARSVYGQRFTITFSLNTNASLITDEVAQKLKYYKVKVASSLDGIQTGNDKVRLTKRGKGTFQTIIVGFDRLMRVGYYPMDNGWIRRHH